MTASIAPSPNAQAIGRLIRRLIINRASTEEFIRTAQRIYSWQPVGPSLQSGVLAYLEMTTPAYETGKSAGREEYTAASHLVGILAWIYAEKLPLNEEGEVFLYELLGAFIEKAKNDPNPVFRLAYTINVSLLEHLSAAYLKRSNAVKAIRKHFRSGAQIPSEQRNEALKSRADTVSRRLIELRTYGVKPCIMQDGIMHTPNMCWVFQDGYDEVAKVPERFKPAMRTPLAITILAKKDDVDSLETVVKTIGMREELYSVGPSFPFDMMLAVQTDGELTVDVVYGMYPLRQAFEEADCEDLFEAFRLTHLMRLADLIIPETIKRERQVPEWPTFPRRRKDRQAYIDDLEKQFTDLWVPRVRIIDDPILPDELQREASEGEQYTRQLSPDVTSSIKNVVGFMKPLPKGCVASPEARQLAMDERGLEIPDGHTYVRAHPHTYYTRGESAGHIARRRQPKTKE